MGKKNPKIVVVKKSQWHTGGGNSNHGSALRVRETRRMCCLGFAARDAGCKGLTDVSYPSNLASEEYEKFKTRFPELTNKVCSDLANINDSEDTTRDEKAEKIAAKGKEVGVNFVFVP